MGGVTDTSNDYMIAQMIQHEFDKEFDHEVKLKESKFNADSKGAAQFDMFLLYNGIELMAVITL